MKILVALALVIMTTSALTACTTREMAAAGAAGAAGYVIGNEVGEDD